MKWNNFNDQVEQARITDNVPEIARTTSDKAINISPVGYTAICNLHLKKSMWSSVQHFHKKICINPFSHLKFMKTTIHAVSIYVSNL